MGDYSTFDAKLVRESACHASAIPQRRHAGEPTSVIRASEDSLENALREHQLSLHTLGLVRQLLCFPSGRRTSLYFDIATC
jgi:hypothetical protein